MNITTIPDFTPAESLTWAADIAAEQAEIREAQIDQHLLNGDDRRAECFLHFASAYRKHEQNLRKLAAQ